MTDSHYTNRRTVLKTVPAAAIGGSIGQSTAGAVPGADRGAARAGKNELEVVAEHDHEAEEHRFDLSTNEVNLGWLTLTFDNDTDHTHIVAVFKIPQTAIDAAEEADEALLDYYHEHVTGPFQYLMDDIAPEKEPDPEDLSDEYSDPGEGDLFPPWSEEILANGGVGLTSPGRTSVATFEIEPGEYLVECYVKDENEEFHSYNGMADVLSVADERGGSEPDATVDISLRSEEPAEDGALRASMDVDGPFRTGRQTVAVHFEDQQLFENVTSHDVNLIRLDEDASIDAVNDWVNWMEPGQFVSDETEPGTFLGGVQQLETPELFARAERGGEDEADGSEGTDSGDEAAKTAYFRADLNPGAYALVSEVPNPRAVGLLETFTISFDDAAAIDPQWGYPTADAAAVPDDLEPDHQVDLLVSPPAGPGQPPFLYFDPVGIHVETDDVVQFNVLTPDHTITAMHPEIGLGPRVPDAASPFSSPILGPGMAWLYRFEHEGVYDMYCGPHLDLGMVMRLVAGDLAEADLPEYARTVEDLPGQDDVSDGLNAMSERNENCEWPFLMPAGVLGTDALDAMRIQEAGAVPFADVAEELGYEFQPPGAEDGGQDDGDGDGDRTGNDGNG